MDYILSILNDPLIILVIAFLFATVLIILLRWIKIRFGIDTTLPEKIIEDQKEEIENKIQEEISKKKQSKKMLILILLLLPIISSCQLLNAGYGLLKDNIEITWKQDNAKSLTPVDSIVIKSNPVYWKEISSDSISFEKEKMFNKNGYTIWRLETPNYRRYEVQRLDTVIYIYRK